MIYHLGNTRSSLKADHLVQTPDTFIRTPLPGAEGVEFIIHTGPRLGAAFMMATAEFAAEGTLSDPLPTVQRFVYVLEGKLALSDPESTQTLTAGSFFYQPVRLTQTIRAIEASRAVIIEKPYEPSASGSEAFNSKALRFFHGREGDVPSELLGGDASLQVRRLMPDGETWDFAVNTMTYDPGASLAMVEIHIMEHGLLMLEGGGIYRLGENWYPVTAGDFIWMAPYCPQWFGAIGKTPAKYLIYKNWYRHPLGK